MGDFFHGYRRQLGGVTLVLACALMVVWTRSAFVGDQISIHHAPFHHFTYSKCGLFQWDRYIDTPADPSSQIGRVLDARNQWVTLPPDVWDNTGLWQQTVMDWQIEFGSLRIGVGRQLAGYDNNMNPVYFSVGSCVIPYCVLVIPLTLISAFLLLSDRSNSRDLRMRHVSAADSQISNVR